ncbi:MAG: glycerophosphodiester phosphodiesterase family protein, partial [Vicinamibacterales bacterium]
SAEGVAVVIHDTTLDRTTDHRGPVHALTADALARVDAGHRFERDGAYPFRGQGIGIPTLETVLRRYPAARVIIEMKGGEPELAGEVARVVRRVEAVDRICVGSFYQTSIDAFRRESPDLPSSAALPEARWALYRSWLKWPRIGPRPYVAFLVPERAGRMRVVSRNFIRQVHQEGQVLQVWVVDTAADARRLLDWGVDGLITDRPDVTVPARNGWALGFNSQ